MNTVRYPKDCHAACRKAAADGHRIGFVPTMGFLHEGHLSLIRTARLHADFVVVSIFVNPTQFGPGEDLAAYPRNLERDAECCRGEGVDLLFTPLPEDMYARDHSVYVDERMLSRGLCGASRPGHFRGVATVVAKLFNIVMPDIAVFGQKDAQQVRVIQRMVRDLCFPVSIVVSPIVREPDGLAMSSRNAYLSPPERVRAAGIRRALLHADARFREGVHDVRELRAFVEQALVAEAGAEIDYVAIVDDETLVPVEHVETAAPALLVVAVRIGSTRLIDNLVLGRNEVEKGEIGVYE